MPTGFVEFLLWLGSAGGVGAILSEFFEHEQWYQAKSEQWKSRFQVVLTIALGLVGYLGVTYLVPIITPEWLKIITLILTPISVYLGGQLWHDKQHSTAATTDVSLQMKTSTPAPQGESSTQTVNSATNITNDKDVG